MYKHFFSAPSLSVPTVYTYIAAEVHLLSYQAGVFNVSLTFGLWLTFPLSRHGVVDTLAYVFYVDTCSLQLPSIWKWFRIDSAIYPLSLSHTHSLTFPSRHHHRGLLAEKCCCCRIIFHRIDSFCLCLTFFTARWMRIFVYAFRTEPFVRPPFCFTLKFLIFVTNDAHLKQTQC